MADDGFYGWINNPAETERIVATLPMPLFSDAAPHLKDTGADKDVLLYELFRKQVGDDAPPGPQGIGDCVSWGWGNFLNYTQITEIAAGQPYEYQEIATESVYALSRVEIGGQRGSYQDGSVGAWAAKAVNMKGCLSRAVVGPYSSKRAKDWGAKGLPDDLEPTAAKNLIKTVSLIKTYETARDAIANGYTVPVCSNRGFSMTRDKDGFCRPEGTWYHCMLFIASRVGSRPGLCLSQSWGKNTPSGPLTLGQPSNTFWVDADVCNSMLKQGDSFTGSAFQGYPARDVLTWRH